VTEKSFVVTLPETASISFAEFSGDWNPLHTNAGHAKDLGYSGLVLHGAYSAALISRLAGMYLPGTNCLLQRLRINFLKPILPPVELEVKGKQTSENSRSNHVEVEILNRHSGTLLCTGSYDFSMGGKPTGEGMIEVVNDWGGGIIDSASINDRILLTGATGGLGQSIRSKLGDRIVPLDHKLLEGKSTTNVVEMIKERLVGNACTGIIMCGWPTPDNKPLLSIETPETQIQYQISRPLGIAIGLAKALSEIGTSNAPLIIVGSTFSKAGKHAWQHPLYSLGKTLVPTLVQILGVELGTKSKKVIGVEFDVLDGGMSEGISELAKQLNRDRSPFGRIGTTDDAAENVIWLLSNTSFLVNGSTITLNGGALP